MIYKTYRIGEICSMVKGTYPTMKTEPGEYPLVVTAEYRRSASTYQLEGPAVCVPLISSTGHGDAALHRVHYQEGKFALANLLVALIPSNLNLCDARYLYQLLMTKKDQYFVPLMSGTANVSLKIQDIADVEIPLPPIDEQRRIVARIEELAVRIEEARGLKREVCDDCEELCRSMLSDTVDGASILTPMREIVKLRELDITVSPEEIYWFAGIYSFGKGLFRGQRKPGTEFSYTRLTRLKTDNFVYPKLMAWEGAFAVVPPEYDGLAVSPEFPVFEIDQERALPETLEVYFHIPSVWSAVSGASTGTNVRRRRLNPADFLAFEIPLPPMKTQKRLREVKAKLDQMKPLQSETSAELDALLPSILDKAFKGEL